MCWRRDVRHPLTIAARGYLKTSPEFDRSPPPWTRVQWSLLIVLALVSVALGWQTRTAVLGVDEATYVALSQSLESGDYRDEWLVGSPRHAQYPPGMPAWLLLVRMIAGPSQEVAVVANLLVFVVGAMFLADALRRLGMAATGVAAAAVMLLNPALLTLAGMLRSEPLFITLMSASLWATVAVSRTRAKPRHALAFVLACAAFLTRSAGLSLLGGVSWTVLRKRRLTAILAIVCSAAVVILWFWYSRSASTVTTGRSYASDITFIEESARGLVSHAVLMARDYTLRTPFSQFGVPNVPGTRLDTVVWVLLLLGAAGIGLPTMYRLWPAAVVNLVLSAALLLIWPWSEARFMSPLVPWVTVSLLLGFSRLAQWSGTQHRERGALIAAAVLCGVGLWAQIGAVRVARDCRDRPSFTEPACHNAEARQFATASRFIRDSVPKDAIIATGKPAKVYVLAERRTVSIWTVPTDAERFPAPLTPERTYVLLAGLTGYEQRAAVELQRHCRRWTVRGRFPTDAVLLQTRDTAASSAEADACSALADYTARFRGGHVE